MLSVNAIYSMINQLELTAVGKGGNQQKSETDNDGSMVPEPERGTKMYMFGCGLSVMASCLRAFSMAGSQMLDDIVGEFQLNIGRFGSMLAFIVPFLIILKPPMKISTPVIIPLILLALDTFACNIFIYASTVYIPVGTAITVINVSFLGVILVTSIVNITCSDAPWDGRSLVADVIAVMLTCVGVIFIVQPPDLFHNNVEHQKYKSFCNPNRFSDSLLNNADNATLTSQIDIYKHESWKGYVHATLAGICNAVRVILNKKVLKTENIYTVIFWTAFSATSLSLVCTLIFERFIFPENVWCTLIVLGHASATGLQTILLIGGVKYVHSTDVTLIYSFSIALLFLFQFTFLREASPAPHNVLAVCAAVVVTTVSIGKPMMECLFARYVKENNNDSKL